jgi:hypothetical protein
MNNKEIISVVREILVKDWDPCGVGGNDALKDEYDGYLHIFVALITQKSSSTTITQTLIELEKELGIAIPVQQRERVVRRLREILP